MLALALLLHLPPVLMYHQVDTVVPTTAVGRALTVSPQQFAEELEYLERHHRRAVSIGDYLAAVRQGRTTDGMVIITFDDGYADQYTKALPILRAHHAHATFFITTGNVGRMNHVTWRDISIMRGDGMGFGGHSVDHIDLAHLSYAQQSYQIIHCLDALRVHGIAADAYAYPSGAFDRTTESVLARSEIALAFTTDPRFEINASPQFEVPRIRVIRDMSIPAFAAALTTPEPSLRFSLAPLPMPRKALRAQAQPRQASPEGSEPK